MLSAYLYRIRKQALKKPVILILGILAVAFCVLMLFYPVLLEEEVTRNTNLVIGGINLLLIALADFMFYSGLKSGVVGYSNADVNFHLAGPFTERFNLVIAAGGVMKLAAIFLWVLCCQVAVLVSSFGVNTVDMFAIIFSACLVIIISYALGAFFASKFDDNEKAKKMVVAIWAVINVALLGGGLVSLVKTYGSIAAVRALGAQGIISALGGTLFVKAFPAAGWVALIYSGILLKDIVYTVLGIVLTVASIALVVILFRNSDINYYETAIINAQKVADMVESRKAGIDSDSAKLNEKVKVGKETLKSGWGAGAFMQRHLLENKRSSKFFFVNSLTLLYRAIVLVYLFIMKNSLGDPNTTVIAGVAMIVILNSIVYSGGKTVLEFNRPYIFMVPEPGYKKIFSCLSASIVEIVFDSLISVAILWFFGRFDAVMAVTLFVTLTIFDLLCQLIAIVQMRIMRNLGRILLMTVRYFIIYGVIIICAIPAIVVGIIFKNIVLGLVASAALGAILCGVFLIFTRTIVDNVELS